VKKREQQRSDYVRLIPIIKVTKKMMSGRTFEKSRSFMLNLEPRKTGSLCATEPINAKRPREAVLFVAVRQALHPRLTLPVGGSRGSTGSCHPDTIPLPLPPPTW